MWKLSHTPDPPLQDTRGAEDDLDASPSPPQPPQPPNLSQSGTSPHPTTSDQLEVAQHAATQDATWVDRRSPTSQQASTSQQRMSCQKPSDPTQYNSSWDPPAADMPGVPFQQVHPEAPPPNHHQQDLTFETSAIFTATPHLPPVPRYLPTSPPSGHWHAAVLPQPQFILLPSSHARRHGSPPSSSPSGPQNGPAALLHAHQMQINQAYTYGGPVYPQGHGQVPGAGYLPMHPSSASRLPGHGKS